MKREKHEAEKRLKQLQAAREREEAEHTKKRINYELAKMKRREEEETNRQYCVNERLQRERKQQQQRESTSAQESDQNHTSSSGPIQPNEFFLPKLSYIGTKLTDKMHFKLWQRRIKQYIVSEGAGWTIGEGVKEILNTEVKPNQLCAAVAECIVHVRHLDDEHYRLLPYTEDEMRQLNPQHMLTTLEQALAPSGKVLMLSYREQLGRLKFDPREDTVLKFQTKFRDLTEKMKRCGAIQDSEPQLALIQSIKESFDIFINYLGFGTQNQNTSFIKTLRTS